MADSNSIDTQNAFFQRARKGVVKFVVDNGGTSQLGEMHTFSESRFFIGHQSFSRLMESLVDEKLVEFDHTSGAATVTDLGKVFCSKL